MEKEPQLGNREPDAYVVNISARLSNGKRGVLAVFTERESAV